MTTLLHILDIFLLPLKNVFVYNPTSSNWRTGPLFNKRISCSSATVHISSSNTNIKTGWNIFAVTQEQEANSVAVCPQPCINYSTCSACLEAPDCHWSTQLDECVSESHQDVYCAGGVCGLVLRPQERQHCPEPCNTFTQCTSCLKHAPCGWCAMPGLSGEGFCTEGSNERPMLGTCKDVFIDNNKKVLVNFYF